MKFYKIITAIVAPALLLGCGARQKTDVLLKTGEVAPAFLAVDNTGEDITLEKLLNNGPVILTFLRSFY